MQKRKYNKGFYFSSVKRHQIKTAEDITIVSDKIRENKTEIVREEQAIVVNSAEIIASEKPIEPIKTDSEKENKKNSFVKQEQQAVSTINMSDFEKDENVNQNIGATKSFNQKSVKRTDFFDAMNNIWLGYYIIVSIIGLISLAYFLSPLLFPFLPFNQAVLLGSLILILLVAICGGIGSMVNGF